MTCTEGQHHLPAPPSLRYSPIGPGGDWMMKLRLQRSDSREKAGVDYLEDSLRGLVQHSKGVQGKETGPAREARDHCCWYILMPHACKEQLCPQWWPTKLAGAPVVGLDSTAVYYLRWVSISQ